MRIARRELSAISAEKTIVLVLLVQLFIAGFSSFLVVGLTALYDPAATDGGAVEIAVTGEASDALLAAGRSTDGALVSQYDDRAAAAAAFDADQVDAVLVATTDRTTDGSRIAVEAIVPDSSLRKTLIVVQLRELLETTERDARDRRNTSIERALVARPPVVAASPYFGFSYTILVPLLLLLPAFIAGSTVVDSVAEERERGTLELLRVTPLSLADIVAGKGAAMVALVPVQGAVWLGLLTLNGIEISNITLLLGYATALALLLVASGVTLALTMATRQRAQLFYSLGALTAFTLAGFLPAHPATTLARLAIDSPTVMTYALVGLTGGAALLGTFAVSQLLAVLDPESL